MMSVYQKVCLLLIKQGNKHDKRHIDQDGSISNIAHDWSRRGGILNCGQLQTCFHKQKWSLYTLLHQLGTVCASLWTASEAL